jgi:hypothetical protein
VGGEAGGVVLAGAGREEAAGRDGLAAPADLPVVGHGDPPERDVPLLPPAAAAGPGPAGAAGWPPDEGGVTRTAEPGRGGASPLRAAAPACAPVRDQPDAGAPSAAPARGGRFSGGAESRPPSASPPGQRFARSAVAGRPWPACAAGSSSADAPSAPARTRAAASSGPPPAALAAWAAATLLAAAPALTAPAAPTTPAASAAASPGLRRAHRPTR